jgi:hypothetical protein
MICAMLCSVDLLYAWQPLLCNMFISGCERLCAINYIR